MDNPTAIIYSLADPESLQIRYVGKTINPKLRFNAHVCPSSNDYHKCNWIRSLLARGVRPEMETLEVIENSNDEDWQEPERFWIEYLTFLGCSLTNATSGGQSGKRLSEQSKRKMSLAKKANPTRYWLGKTRSDFVKQRLSESKIGKAPPNKGTPSPYKGIPRPLWVRKKISATKRAASKAKREMQETE